MRWISFETLLINASLTLAPIDALIPFVRAIFRAAGIYVIFE